jgi:outer membrane putative beta-barrel porin/alpha-amylase
MSYCRILLQIIIITSAVFHSASAEAQSPKPQDQFVQSKCANDDEDLINADRPGIADGSTVVGPKTFQLESGIQQEFRRSGNIREHTFFAPTLVRFGINSQFEARVEGNTFTRVSTFVSANPINQVSGFAPVSLGFKYQFTDPKSDHKLYLGTIVRVFPTWGSKEFRTQHATGDIRLAADWKFAPCLSLNPNVGIARYEDDEGKLFTTGLFAVTLNYNPTKKLNPFIDVGIQAPETRGGQTSVILDGGIAYIIGQNLQLDASFGTRVHGETGPRPFLAFGISWRWKPVHAKH